MAPIPTFEWPAMSFTSSIPFFILDALSLLFYTSNLKIAAKLTFFPHIPFPIFTFLLMRRMETIFLGVGAVHEKRKLPQEQLP
jgi:hypothetical protein